ncbi:unnamed protein product [Auanema sp. JU1783]|nr:unnamed protein product [Auanema sp. JU1783]
MKSMLVRKILLILIVPSLAQALGWAGWSSWTSCSRSCGGGVSQQLRRCLDEKCSGHSVRYRVCNVADCYKPSRAERDTVCSGQIILSRQQCEVVCRSRNTGTSFLWRVTDGTPCQAASSRAVCSQGSCQVVGCDDVIGSSLRFDACGVCGGRGDTCDSAQFVWKESGEFTPCAGSCGDAAASFHNGRDIRESHSITVCVNSNTGRVVPERLCADRKKPISITRPCPPLICPSNWLSSDWTECSPACGSGRRTRSVYCVHQTTTHSVSVPDSFCQNQTKPTSEEVCSTETCGRWETGRWSRCSASCGQGIRRRTVECVGGTDCSVLLRPPSETQCYTGIPCHIGPNIHEPQAWVSQEQNLDWNDRRYLDGTSFNPMEQNSHGPRIIPGPWSACSATCGPGVESRAAECMALHPITANLIKLPMSECASLTQPLLFQPCEVRACPLQEDSKVMTDTSPFKWEHGEWTQCSASCLGGKQKAALKCIATATGRPVAWSQCDARTRPPEKVRACNQQACPPMWQVGPFDSCSTSCGGGTSSRSVKCVRPVSRSGGADAHIVLADSDCSLPKPAEAQECAASACPPTWITGEWTECSASCGSGEQRRRVSCEGRDGRGRRQRRTEKECPGEKPISIQMCSLGSCEKPQLYSNRVFEQNASEKKLTLGIGGVATLFQGTSIKIKCPRKNFDKKRIYWTKNGKKIRNDAHIKVSSNGNLRIFHARLEDAGVYECFTDSLQGNVTLRFKYRDEKEHVLSPSEMMRPQTVSKPSTVNTSIIEALLAASSDADVTSELQKHRDIIQAEWDIGHWADCKQTTCSVAGYQAREVRCTVSIDKGSRKKADESICIALVSNRPPETRPCHRENCPRWEAEDWTECAQSKCLRDGIALQKRNVQCALMNGTEVDPERCDRISKPKTKRECPSSACKAEWRTSDWRPCSSTCGTGGVQLRMLSCMWSVSGKPAGRNCEGSRRPSAARACPFQDLPACSPEALALQQDETCDDQSRYCDIIKLFQSCDTKEVRERCCATCRYMETKRRI